MACLTCPARTSAVLPPAAPGVPLHPLIGRCRATRRRRPRNVPAGMRCATASPPQGGGYTMRRDYQVYVGVDVGKSAHHAYAVTASGEVLFSARIGQDAAELAKLFGAMATAGPALVVVDQPKNIGALTLACARRAGCHVAYLPGLSVSKASALFPGDSKTDERDAEVIARTAMGIPESLVPVNEPDPAHERAARLSAYQQGLVKDRAHYVNRLRSALVESNPAFEAVCDFDVDFYLDLIARFGGPWGAKRAGRSRFMRWAGSRRYVRERTARAAWEAIDSMPAPIGMCEAVERLVVGGLARKVRDLGTEIARLAAEIDACLSGDATYVALLTVPGVGPKVAAALTANVNIDSFPDSDHLASYVGLAPRTRQSGTSLRSVRASRGGNKMLKRCLYYSCLSLLLGDNPFHAYYDGLRARGKTHGQALKAVARKRMKIIYAVMRDKKPYSEETWCRERKTVSP